MAETILVTGATGNVGSEVVKQLYTGNISIRAGGRSRENGYIMQLMMSQDLATP
jgi:uncharacterized protein YbjT (DUF2867 family)